MAARHAQARDASQRTAWHHLPFLFSLHSTYTARHPERSRVTACVRQAGGRRQARASGDARVASDASHVTWHRNRIARSAQRSQSSLLTPSTRQSISISISTFRCPPAPPACNGSCPRRRAGAQPCARVACKSHHHSATAPQRHTAPPAAAPLPAP